LGLERATTTDYYGSRRVNPRQQHQTLQNACSWSFSMAHGGLFATYMVNIPDASVHTAVRENKVADGVLRHLVHGLHQGDHYYQSVTHGFRTHARVTAIVFTIPRELTTFLHRLALNSKF